jgi:hypothetical protein
MSVMTRFASVLLAALGLVVLTPSEASAQTKLRIATLAPKNSAWGKVFKVWSKAVDQKSGGKLQLDIYYNAVQGNEDSMVGKMKTGQLDGAALTSVGLSRVYKDVLVLQLPGVVDSWAVLDKVRGELQGDFEKSFEAEGFKVVGWGDVGLVRQMSKGFAIRKPSDMKGKHPIVWRNEPMGPTVYSVIGGVVPVPMSPTEVLPALRSGKVDVINAPAGKSNALCVRKLDDEAFTRISAKMTKVELTAAEKSEWEKVLRESVKRLGQGTFNKGLIDRVLKITGMRAWSSASAGVRSKPSWRCSRCSALPSCRSGSGPRSST